MVIQDELEMSQEWVWVVNEKIFKISECTDNNNPLPRCPRLTIFLIVLFLKVSSLGHTIEPNMIQMDIFLRKLIKTQQRNSVNLTMIDHSVTPFVLISFA